MVYKVLCPTAHIIYKKNNSELTKNNNIEVRTKPFLRWAGGKNSLTKHIETYLPENFKNYFEPFFGGGSIYFYLKSKGLIKNKLNRFTISRSIRIGGKVANRSQYKEILITNII